MFKSEQIFDGEFRLSQPIISSFITTNNSTSSTQNTSRRRKQTFVLRPSPSPTVISCIKEELDSDSRTTEIAPTSFSYFASFNSQQQSTGHLSQSSTFSLVPTCHLATNFVQNEHNLPFKKRRFPRSELPAAEINSSNCPQLQEKKVTPKPAPFYADLISSKGSDVSAEAVCSSKPIRRSSKVRFRDASTQTPKSMFKFAQSVAKLKAAIPALAQNQSVKKSTLPLPSFSTFCQQVRQKTQNKQKVPPRPQAPRAHQNPTYFARHESPMTNNQLGHTNQQFPPIGGVGAPIGWPVYYAQTGSFGPSSSNIYLPFLF